MTKNQAFIILRFLAVMGALIIAIYSFLWIFSLTYPFWIASLLVWMFYPLVRVLNKKARLPRGVAVFVVLFFSLVTIAGVITGLVFLIIFGTRRVTEFIPEWIETIAAHAQYFFNETILSLWQKLGEALDVFTPELQSTLQGGITNFGAKLADYFSAFAQRALEGLTQLLAGIPTFIIAFVFIFVAFYFIGKDWERLLKWGQDLIPNPSVKRVILFKDTLRYRVFGFLKAQLILMFIAAFIVFIGMTILRVEHSITIAIIVGIAEILPYFGSGTILIPWFLYMFFTGNISMGIGLAIVYAVTFAVRQSIEPKVLSASMNINALAALVSLFVGIKMFGVFGVFLGPLLLIVLVVVIEVGLARDVLVFIKYGFKTEKKQPEI